METFIPYLRLVHFIGFSFLLGGTLSSFILTKARLDGLSLVKGSYRLMHLIAAPGLFIILLSGLWHSFTLSFQNFKGAGYMHAKSTLVMFILILMILDIRLKKQTIKKNLEYKEIALSLKNGQLYEMLILVMCLIVMYLISFKPF